MIPLSCGSSSIASPRGWRWAKLIELARLESGHTPSRRHPEWWGGAIPWIALPDIRALDGKVVFDTAEHVNEDGIANSAARILPAGTVVLSRTASVGFVTIMGRPMATSQDFVNWVCGPDLDPHFLALIFRSSREYIRSLGSGAVHKTVYVPTVENFYICLPSLIEQKRILGILIAQMAAVERARAAADAQVGTLVDLQLALLRKAFSGAL
jgi:type I restriction enzyme S subunit